MNLVNEKSASDLVRPQVFKPAGSASSLEVRVAKALDSLFPNKDIITEHPIHPWLPDVDFFLVEDNVIIEVQGPYHNRKVMEDSEDGELLMRRQTGNSFDRGKYDIFKAMGYRVIELELEHLRGSIEDIAKLITRRLEQPGDRL